MRDVILAGFVLSILIVSSDASGDTRCDEDRPMIDCVEMLVNRLATFERAYFSDRDSTSREMDALREELRELKEEQAAFPVGAIVAVRGRCPSGWDEYEDARGRVLVGANDRFALGESGGSRNIRIERENLPSITLRLPTWRSHGGDNTAQTDEYTPRLPHHAVVNADALGNYSKHSRRTEVLGKGRTIPHMPPYRVVRYCIRT